VLARTGRGPDEMTVQFTDDRFNPKTCGVIVHILGRAGQPKIQKFEPRLLD
jgi:hypothetical protein